MPWLTVRSRTRAPACPRRPDTQQAPSPCGASALCSTRQPSCCSGRPHPISKRNKAHEPKVLISDELSPPPSVFKERGVDVDVKVGLSKEQLEQIIGNYDGLAVRSATKVTEKIIAAGNQLKVVGRAGIGVDNIDTRAATTRGIIVMNTPYGNSITTAEHAISLMLALAADSQADRSTKPASGRSRSHGSSCWQTLASSAAAILARSSADAASGSRSRLAYDPFLRRSALSTRRRKARAGSVLHRQIFITPPPPLTAEPVKSSTAKRWSR